MPVAFEAANSAVSSSEGVSDFPDVSVTPAGSDRALLIALSWNANPTTDLSGPPTVGGSSTGVTLIAEFDGTVNVINGDDRRRMALYYLLNPAASSLTVDAALTAANGSNLCLGAVAYSGVHQTTPTGTAVLTEGNSSSPSASVSDGNAAGMIASFLAAFFPASTVAHGQTQRFEHESGGGFDAVAAFTDTTGASATMTHTLNTAAPWGQIAVALLPAGTQRRWLFGARG
jgi:hypothetical protein